MDTLVHNFLKRTGILRRFDVEHAYEPALITEQECEYRGLSKRGERIPASTIALMTNVFHEMKRDPKLVGTG